MQPWDLRQPEWSVLLTRDKRAVHFTRDSRVRNKNLIFQSRTLHTEPCRWTTRLWAVYFNCSQTFRLILRLSTSYLHRINYRNETVNYDLPNNILWTNLFTFITTAYNSMCKNYILDYTQKYWCTNYFSINKLFRIIACDSNNQL